MTVTTDSVTSPPAYTDSTVFSNYIPDDTEALIFDCDGTLIDSMPFFYGCWVKALKQHDMHFPIVHFYRLAGTPIRDIVLVVLELNDCHHIGTATEEKKDPSSKKPSFASVEERDAWASQLLKDMEQESFKLRENGVRPQLIECTARIVKHYSELGVPLAVASSGEKHHVVQDLEHAGLAKYFQAIVTREDAVNGKPAPDLFLEAQRQLEEHHKRKFTKIVGFEDADLGMEALQRADMKAVDVRRFHDYPRPKEGMELQ